MNGSNLDFLTRLGNRNLIQSHFNQYAGDQAKFGIVLIDIDGLIYSGNRCF